MEAAKVPKIEIVRSTAKCFKKTGKGSSRHKHADLCYVLIKKIARRKRHLCPKVMASRDDLGPVIAYLLYA